MGAWSSSISLWLSSRAISSATSSLCRHHHDHHHHRRQHDSVSRSRGWETLRSLASSPKPEPPPPLCTASRAAVWGWRLFSHTHHHQHHRQHRKNALRFSKVGGWRLQFAFHSHIINKTVTIIMCFVCQNLSRDCSGDLHYRSCSMFQRYSQKLLYLRRRMGLCLSDVAYPCALFVFLWSVCAGCAMSCSVYAMI